MRPTRGQLLVDGLCLLAIAGLFLWAVVAFAQTTTPGGLNLNQQAIMSRQNGGKLSNTRQYAIDCGGALACSVDGGVLRLWAADAGLPETTGAQTLYVDPAGSDGNACTAAGPATACATVAGAMAKVPFFIKHAVTINVAAGTYAEAINLANRQFVPPTATTSGSISIVGPTKSTFTPATGTSSGTVTTLNTASASEVYGEITDSTQSWTADDLDGRFIRFTSGPATNPDTRAIVGNTATTLRFHPLHPLPAVGNGYVIETPGATFTSVSASTLGLGTINLFNLDFSAATPPCANTTATNTPDTQIVMAGVRCVATGTTGAASLTFLSGSSTNGRGSAIFLALNAGLTSPGLVISMGLGRMDNGFYVKSVSSLSPSARINYAMQRGTNRQWLNAYSKNTSLTGDAMEVLGSVSDGAQNTVNAGVGVECPAGSTGSGLVPSGLHTRTPYNNVRATNCAIGVEARQSASEGTGGTNFTAGTLTCTNTATCLLVADGARARVVNSAFSGVTNDYNVDGTNYSSAQFLATTGPRIIGTALSVLDRNGDPSDMSVIRPDAGFVIWDPLATTGSANDRVLTAGTNITLDTSTPGQVIVNASGGGGGGSVNTASGVASFDGGSLDAYTTVTAAWVTGASVLVCRPTGEEASVEGLQTTVTSQAAGSFVVRSEPRIGTHTGTLPFVCMGN